MMASQINTNVSAVAQTTSVNQTASVQSLPSLVNSLVGTTEVSKDSEASAASLEVTAGLSGFLGSSKSSECIGDNAKAETNTVEGEKRSNITQATEHRIEGDTSKYTANWEKVSNKAQEFTINSQSHSTQSNCAAGKYRTAENGINLLADRSNVINSDNASVRRPATLQTSNSAAARNSNSLFGTKVQTYFVSGAEGSSVTTIDSTTTGLYSTSTSIRVPNSLLEDHMTAIADEGTMKEFETLYSFNTNNMTFSEVMEQYASFAQTDDLEPVLPSIKEEIAGLTVVNGAVTGGSIQTEIEEVTTKNPAAAAEAVSGPAIAAKATVAQLVAEYNKNLTDGVLDTAEMARRYEKELNNISYPYSA